jgi:hypothetical protein
VQDAVGNCKGPVALEDLDFLWKMMEPLEVRSQEVTNDF